MIATSRACHAEASVDSTSAGFVCFFLGLVLLLPTAFLSGQQVLSVRSVAVRGNQGISEEEIVSWLHVRTGIILDDRILANDREVVRQRYAQEGFFSASVDSISVLADGQNHTVDLIFHLHEDAPTMLGSLRLEGNRALTDDDLKTGLSSVVDERFRQVSLERDIQLMLNRYAEHGFPLARVTIKDIALASAEGRNRADLVLTVEEGKEASISEIKVEGNTVTRQSVINRETRLGSDAVFTPELQTRIQARLQRMQVFSSVEQPELYIRPDGSFGMLLRVSEGNPNRFDGIVGYVPSTGSSGSGYFTGLADVQFRNLFGTGRKFSARWFRENQSTQEIGIRYVEPWIASFPVNGEAGFFQRKQDSSYVQRQYDLHLELMSSEEFRFGVSLAYAGVVPSLGLAGKTTDESQTTSVGGFLTFDSRDDAITPTLGIFYRTNFETGTKRRTVGSSSVSNSMQRLTMDGEYSLSVVQRQVLNVGLHLREFRSGGIDASDLFRLGGASTVRGYREGQFLASRAAWMSVEYRYHVAPRSFLFSFVDAAYVVAPDLAASGIPEAELTRFGYGVGMRLNTALGNLGVSIGFGQGDTFSTAKLHLRVVNEF
jgi:outer membrane protein insertion porin family